MMSGPVIGVNQTPPAASHGRLRLQSRPATGAKTPRRRSQQPRRFRRPTHPPAPRRPAGLPSVKPHDRGRRLRPDADRAALVDGGAFGCDAADERLRRSVWVCHFVATLSRRSAVEVRHGGFQSYPVFVAVHTCAPRADARQSTHSEVRTDLNQQTDLTGSSRYGGHQSRTCR
jgi:hypothetical protein